MRFAAALAGLAALAVELGTTTAHAWLFVEHTEIGRTAMAGGTVQVPPLTKAQRDALDLEWQALRSRGNLGPPGHLAAALSEMESPVECRPDPMDAHGTTLVCPPDPKPSPFALGIDLPMLAALAADHSCSTEDLTTTVRSTWVHPLIKMFSRNYDQIRSTDVRSAARVSFWHATNLQAQRIDEAYLSRAAHNMAHFVLPRTTRSGVAESRSEYVRRASAIGEPINAVGLYATYHARALDAARVHSTNGGAALLFEAMALHFLEDAFAGGHLVGDPKDGSSASRSGTHDYYCENGITITTWDGTTTYPAFGDAHMRHQDRLMVSQAVRASLVQVAGALLGELSVPAGCARSVVPDVCASGTLPGVGDDCAGLMESTVALLPVPPLERAPQPQFRNEVGVFLRFALSANGGFGWTSAAAPPSPGPVQTVPAWGLAAGIGVGFSAAGVTTSSSDATAFLQFGISAASGQRTQFCAACSPAQEPIETRLGLDFRLRLPYLMVPGDFLVLGPAAALGSKWAYDRVVQTAEGGLYGRWERVFTMDNGTAFQIVAGREVEVSLYSLSRELTSKNLPLIYSWSTTVPLFEFLALQRFTENTSSHIKITFAARMEHSSAVTAEFAMLSIGSDSHLYVNGL